MEIVSHKGFEKIVSYCEDEKNTIGKILNDLNVKNDRLCIFINGEYPSKIDLDYIVNKNDHIIIYPEINGKREGIKIASTIVLLAASVASAGVGSPGFIGAGAGAFAQAGIRAGILVGASIIVAGLQSFTPNSITSKQKYEGTSYSIGSARNNIRPFEPFPLIMGTHNIFPDFGSIPYNEISLSEKLLVNDINGWAPLASHVYDIVNPPPFSIAITQTSIFASTTFTYLAIANNGSGGVINSFQRYRPANPLQFHPTLFAAQINPQPSIGDLIYETHVYITAPIGPAFNKWVKYSDLQANGLGATFFTDPYTSTSGNFIYSTGQSAQFYIYSQRVKQIFNFGYGDISYAPILIGNIDSSTYRQLTTYGNIETPLNYTLTQNEPIFSTNLSGFQIESILNVNGNVDTSEGGELQNNISTLPTLHYITRKSLNNTFAIQIDIEGNQFRTSTNGDFEPLSIQYDVEYRQVSPVIGPWTFFPNGFHEGLGTISFPYYITWTTSNYYRNTLYVDNLPLGEYEVRVRKVTPDETDKQNTVKLIFSQVRFYKSDVNQKYIAQNRVAMMVNGSSQLQGELQKVSCVVSSKCWAYDGVSSYVWQTTTNPADWFIFVCRGIFENDTCIGADTYPFSPTIGWSNSFDRSGNKERLWGSGISDALIDFENIKLWWQYCNSKNLNFSAVFDDSISVGEVLNRICQVGRASISWASGKIGVVFSDVNDVPSAIFTNENILKDSLSVSYLTEEMPDQIQVNFFNKDKNWEKDFVTATAVGIISPVKKTNIDYFGITDSTQAQKEANLLIAKRYYHRRLISFSIDCEGLIVTRGDVIYLSHDVLDWDYSSRVVSFSHDGIQFKSIKVDCEIKEPITSIRLRKPDNTILNFSCTNIGNEIFFDLPYADGPFYTTQNNDENLLSLYSETVPEDFLCIFGNSADVGKKVRVVSVEPKSMNEFSISCIDEDAGYYAQEFSITGLPLQIDKQRIKAEIINSGYILKGNGRVFIYWDKNGCHAVEIYLKINGGVQFQYSSISGASIFGEHTTLDFSIGDTLEIEIKPFYIDTPYISVSNIITVTLI